jgi:hypothetical protein
MSTDFGCLVWDVANNSTTPLLKVCHNASVAALAWMAPQTLCVAASPYLQLYDLRSATPPVTIRTHVQQMVATDNNHFLTTLSQTQDVIQLWDLRRNLEMPLAELTLPHKATRILSTGHDQWSLLVEPNRILDYRLREGKLVLAQHLVTPTPLMDLCVSHQRYVAVVPTDTHHWQLRDLPRGTDTAPLALPPQGGVVHVQHETLCQQRTTPRDDVSGQIRLRADGPQPYSMDAVDNVQTLRHTKLPNNQDTQRLMQLWTWINGMERQFEDTSTTLLQQHLSRSSLLTEGGVWRLLNVDEPEPDMHESLTSLGLPLYESHARRLALHACGWPTETAATTDYERAAALAVWHNEVGRAVQLLQKGANNKKTNNNNWLQLMSIAIAGYNGANDSVWRQACLHFLQQLEEESQTSTAVAYLGALLRFLLAMEEEKAIAGVLEDERLHLSDRVGFACRFLPQGQLRTQLRKWISACEEQGNVEGLVITGLTMDGIRILQSYVDRTGDVQSAALVTSRVIMPSSWTTERRICSEWLDSYRGLLNVWQMFQSRAMFDVDRAELLRKVSESSRPAPIVPKAKVKQVDPDCVLSPMIPAQLDARCNYCSASLSGARKPDGTSSQWLLRSKNILSCCPRCRKPLPRCAICLLSMGALNPYSKKSGSMAREGDLASLANLPFAEWFTWCMRCKHGGHAHHLVGWFTNHETCPVSGCDCQCQFDGIKKLSHKNSVEQLVKVMENEGDDNEP